MDNVKDILNHKGNQVWAVHLDTKVQEALQLMADKNIGALLVVDDKENLKGIFSERDYARYTVSPDKNQECPWSYSVQELMTKEVLYVTDDKSVDYCMGLMTNRRLRHLPVMKEGTLAGMISIGDVVKAVLTEKSFIIDQMEHYIWDNT
jgi:CBS domain-containing protein